MFSESAAVALTPEDLPMAVLRCRAIALESCLTMLRSGVTSTWFRTEPTIVASIQKTLCLSLSRNAVVTDSNLFELGITVFLLLVAGWRTVLKREIEVLLTNIYLYILEMGNASTQQKLIVLQCLSKIVGESQVMADLYVNYDCEIGREGIFEKIVEVCGRVTQGITPGNGNHEGQKSKAPSGGQAAQAGPLSEDERKLKQQGLRSLVAIVESLVDWSKSVAPVSSAGSDPASLPHDGGLAATGRVGISSDVRSLEAVPILLLKNPLSTITKDIDIPYIYPVGKDENAESVRAGSGSEDRSNGDASSPIHIEATPENVAERKQLLRQAVQLFNSKPKKGLRRFIEAAFVPADDPQAFAAFVRNNASLGFSKAALGELLGEADQDSIKIMHAWIDAMDFAGLAFVDALRSFLQTFRLPGEAQKIDRIMEKFADRYLECNPDSFASADTAYTLAYSVIMLNVDQHSVKVKNKMDKAAFIKNNRGIDSGADLPEALLSSIFDDISSNEIVLEEEREEAERNKQQRTLDERERAEMYKREMAQMQKKSQALMGQKSTGGKGTGHSPLSSSSVMSKAVEEAQLVFKPASNPELARSMFKTACWPLLAALSVMFENEGAIEDSTSGSKDDAISLAKLDLQIQDIAAGRIDGSKGRLITSATDGTLSSVAVSLRGMAGCVRIAGIFKMDTERNAFVSSLAKMTCLNRVSDMRPRHAKAVKSIITLASVLGEHLDSSWLDVLKCISLLERTHMIEARNAFGSEVESAVGTRSGAPSRMSEMNADDHRWSESGAPRTQSIGTELSRTSSFAVSGAVVVPADLAKAANLEVLVKQIQSQDTLVAIDRIFSSTVQFSGPAVLAFFTSLCEVSAEEVGILDGANGPSLAKSTSSSSRIYSLQKVVEVAYYNMFRIRYEFSAIWRILQPHFNTMGCHPDQTVATFAVDALRQLSMKFLERDELSHYNTQSDFLRTFEHIMRNNSNLAIKDLLVQSFKQMIAARASNIRSGWKSIWSVLSRAAHENHPALVKNAFSVAQLVYQEAVETVIAAGGFAEYIACLKEFAQAGQRSAEQSGPRGKKSKPVGEEVIIGSIRLLQGCSAKILELGPAAKVSSAATALGSRRDSFVAREPPDSATLEKPFPAEGEELELAGTREGASEEQFYLMWFPILSALSRVVIDHNSPVVRGEATDALFSVLKQSGHLFDLTMWRNIRRSVILPIFEGLSGSGGEDFENESGDESGPLARWAAAPTSEEAAIWVQGMRELVDLAAALFLRLTEPLELVRIVLDLVVPMIGRRNETLASTGAICLQRFLKDIVPKLSERNGAWELVTEAMERAFDVSMPRDLLFWQYKETDKAKPASLTSPVNGRVGPLDETAQQVIASASSSEFLPAGLADSQGLDDDDDASLARTGSGQLLPRKPPMKRKPTLVMDFDSVIVRAAVHLELIQAARDAALTETSGVHRAASSGGLLGEGRIMDDDAQSTVSTSMSGIGNRGEGASAAGGGPLPLPHCAALALAPPNVRNRWLQLFRDSYVFAAAFNLDVQRRAAIFRRGFVPQMPNLSKQEVVSCTSLVRTMFALYVRDGDAETVEMLAEPSWLSEARAAGVEVDQLPPADCAILPTGSAGAGDAGNTEGSVVRAELSACLSGLVSAILQRFVGQGKDQRRYGKELGHWSPLVATIYRDLGVFVEAHPKSTDPNGGPDRFAGLRRQISFFFRLGIQLIHVDRAEVRWALERFMESISSLISLA